MGAPTQVSDTCVGVGGTPAQVVPHLTTLREECQEKESHGGKRFLRIVSRFASACARREAKDFCELSRFLRTLWYSIGVEGDGQRGKLENTMTIEILTKSEKVWFDVQDSELTFSDGALFFTEVKDGVFKKFPLNEVVSFEVF